MSDAPKDGEGTDDSADGRRDRKAGRARARRQTVVVTGASGGIGRAVVREFAQRGARIGLLARGRAGLEAAAAEVRELGGEALVVPTDVADHRAVATAADAVEEAFGPLDVWVNVAFTSVFAQFTDISPDEFRRVTEVSYLGYVNGTREALARMVPRDHGTVVQVGSALGARSIPLQSAYCGAKHAVNGFTSSVRTELMHRGSNVHVTVVQMPAVNTPQFSWVLTRLPRHPQPVPPIYQPEVAARAVVHAAAHPRRKQYYVGASTVATILGNKVAAGLLDRYLARTGYDSQQTAEPAPPNRPHNLWQPLDRAGGHDFGAHGAFDDRSHARSPQARAARHPRLGLAAAAAAVALGAAATRRRRV
ncbi:SDR family oxidoreductase [Streptomyces sp. NPDC021224]|uniref:SDR family oxidoreductase n=1 Tax=unclassified Streptomyces TaxID=2593676 RepID=UPI0037943A59